MRWRAVFRALVGCYARHERGRTALTVLGVALGVAVLIAIDLANESAVSSFKGTLDDVAGRAQLTVRANGSALDGALVARLAKEPGVRSVSPLIEGQALHRRTPDAPPETLLVLGVDLLASEERDPLPVRDIAFTPEKDRPFTSFLTDPRVVVGTRRFADRAGASEGAEVEFEINGAPVRMVLGGLISGGTLADTLDGNVLVADLGIADALLGRGGKLDRIDLTLDEGADSAEVAARLAESLPANALVERPETRGERVDEMLAAFRFNLNALGHISILVGAFLIFNTMSVAVVRRRPAIGTLRALGVSRRAVAAAFLAEGFLIGAIGSALGVLLGTGLALAMLDTVSAAISINFVQTDPTRLAPDAGIVLAGVLLGIGTSLGAAMGPALEAASTPPANTMRRGSAERGSGGAVPMAVAGAVAFALAAALALREPRGTGLPIGGYIAATLAVGAFVGWSRLALGGAASGLRGVYSRLFGAEGLLAVAGTQATLGRATVAVAGLLVSLAMTVAVGVMVSSFRGTVVGWMGEVLRADLYVSAASPGAGVRPAPIPAAFVSAAEAIPGVEAVDPFRGRRIVVNGREAWFGSGRFDIVRFENQTMEGRPAAEVVREALANREAIVSEAFSRKHLLATGDSVAVPTAAGAVELRIAGVYRDYSSEQGYVIVDRSLFLEFFPGETSADSLSLYLAPGADRAALRERLAALAVEVPGTPALQVRANDELRGFAIEAFDNTFRVTHALQLIAVVVAVLGVAATLLAQILDRQQEITTLRHLGATQWRVAKVIVLESSLLALVGVALGVGAGLALSYILTTVIMLESFGWTIAFDVPWGLVAQSALIVFVATVLAGLIPSREAAKRMRSSGRVAVG
ncbi:MAG: FtsX-like permease family protein [Candidatus Sumerlaeia bacterium]|nr:FtsX-like permease family protein [Candidatus Sumerlaeia bacterium]